MAKEVEDVDFDVYVVLPAGGTGDRFCCNIPKQYCKLGDEPLILHTAYSFQRIPWIKRIIVTASEKYISFADKLFKSNKLDKVIVVEGCSTRHRSIYAGVKAIGEANSASDIVIIHDAVRPFVDEDVVKQVALNAKVHGAAGVTRPLVSTVIKADGENMLVESLDRSQFCASEMPQGFQYSVIKAAYEKSSEYDFDYGTECLLLAMKYTGTKAKLFNGPDKLWKVTYKKDLYAAEGMLKDKHSTVQIKFVQCHQNDDLIKAVKLKCKEKNITVRVGDMSESQLLDSVVFIYTDCTFSQETISKNTKIFQKSVADIDSSPKLQPKHCLIHVYNGESLRKGIVFSFMEGIQNAAKQKTDFLVFGLMNFKIESYTQMAEMVADLLWNRNSVLSGQTFMVYNEDI